jgi:hypothetical protein
MKTKTIIKKLSFELVRDENATPDKRFILRIKVGGVTQYAPRFAFMRTALAEVEGLHNYYAPEQKNIKIDIKL